MPITGDRPYITMDNGHLAWSWENPYSEPFNPSIGSSLNRTDGKKCYICSKKLTSKLYTILNKKHKKVKVCSNCKYIYKFFHKEMIEYNNRIVIVEIWDIISHIKDNGYKLRTKTT